MQRKLTITIDEAAYEGLYRKVGPRKIARFIEEIVRPYVLDADLDAEYQEMAPDEMRKRRPAVNRSIVRGSCRNSVSVVEEVGDARTRDEESDL